MIITNNEDTIFFTFPPCFSAVFKSSIPILNTDLTYFLLGTVHFEEHK